MFGDGQHATIFRGRNLVSPRSAEGQIRIGNARHQGRWRLRFHNLEWDSAVAAELLPRGAAFASSEGLDSHPVATPRREGAIVVDGLPDYFRRLLIARTA